MAIHYWYQSLRKFDLDKIVKRLFKTWMPAPRFRGDWLSGYDTYIVYLILIGLLSFPRRREAKKWRNPY